MDGIKGFLGGGVGGSLRNKLSILLDGAFGSLNSKGFSDRSISKLAVRFESLTDSSAAGVRRSAGLSGLLLLILELFPRLRTTSSLVAGPSAEALLKESRAAGSGNEAVRLPSVGMESALPLLAFGFELKASVAAFAAAGGRLLRVAAIRDDEGLAPSLPGLNVLSIPPLFSGLGDLESFFGRTLELGVTLKVGVKVGSSGPPFSCG